MLIKQSSFYDKDLVNNFELILNASFDEAEEIEKLNKAVVLLSGSCKLLGKNKKYNKVCKKINKSIDMIKEISAQEFEEEDKDESTKEYKEVEEDQVELLQKVVMQLGEACELLEDDDNYKEVCKKITKAIKLVGKVSGIEAKEITSSKEVEEDVQEEIEEQK